MQANDNNRAGSVHGCTQSACLHAGFPTPYPAVGVTGGLALMAEHDDARQASRQCARACGALTRVRRACLWRAQQAVPTSTDPMGILKNRESSRHQAQARNTPVKCEAAAAILASGGPAPVSVGRQHARSSRVAMRCKTSSGEPVHRAGKYPFSPLSAAFAPF